MVKYEPHIFKSSYLGFHPKPWRLHNIVKVWNDIFYHVMFNQCIHTANLHIDNKLIYRPSQTSTWGLAGESCWIHLANYTLRNETERVGMEKNNHN